VPKPNNPNYKDVEGALATCWVLEDDPHSAFVKASFYVRQYEWDIQKVEQYPQVVRLEHFEGRDLGTEQYHIAEKHGIACALAAWARDGESSFGPVQLSPSHPINLQSYLSGIQKHRRRGRCLHFSAGNRCTRIIEAHSIQKNGVLSLVAEHGKVYAPSKSFGDIKKNGGKVVLSKQGISSVSTFRGFCSKHDNEVFSPIDKGPVVPTKEQVLLYAYRSLCRELFVKEYSVCFYEEQLQEVPQDSICHDMYDGLRHGTDIGLKNLKYHKILFDECINEQSFSRMQYVIFRTQQNPKVVFSGLIYPDYDFLGRQLQDLRDHSEPWDLLSFSFVPFDVGWGFLLAWHSNSSKQCVPFVKSLATRIHDGESVGELLFRFVIAGCENIAVNPSWWESLSGKERDAVESTASYGADILKISREDYLATGLGNVAGWEFEYVISKMEQED